MGSTSWRLACTGRRLADQCRRWTERFRRPDLPRAQVDRAIRLVRLAERRRFPTPEPVEPRDLVALQTLQVREGVGFIGERVGRLGVAHRGSHHCQDRARTLARTQCRPE